MLLVLLALTALPPSLVQGKGANAGDGPNRAGLVVRHGDGRLVTACVRFSEPTITGEELLQRAGLDIAVHTFSYGGAVCAIDGEGCRPPAEACFCHCQTMGEACTYWAYSHLGEDGRWRAAGSAASAHTIRDGDVDGWSWGGEGPLPPLSFADVCAAPAAATATATALPTALEPTLSPATAPPSPTPTPGDGQGVAENDQAPPAWGAYASFVVLGALLAGALLWLAQRRGA